MMISIYVSHDPIAYIMQHSMETVESQVLWHTAATIVMESWITGLLEVASQMMTSIYVSHDPITQYYVAFYEKSLLRL